MTTHHNQNKIKILNLIFFLTPNVYPSKKLKHFKNKQKTNKKKGTSLLKVNNPVIKLYRPILFQYLHVSILHRIFNVHYSTTRWATN